MMCGVIRQLLFSSSAGLINSALHALGHFICVKNNHILHFVRPYLPFG